MQRSLVAQGWLKIVAGAVLAPFAAASLHAVYPQENVDGQEWTPQRWQGANSIDGSYGSDQVWSGQEWIQPEVSSNDGWQGEECSDQPYYGYDYSYNYAPSFNSGDCGHFTFFADFLYWDVYQSDTQYVMSARFQEDQPSSDPKESYFDYPLNRKFGKHFTSNEYNPGWRLGGSYLSPCGSWSLDLAYIYYDRKICQRLSPRCDGALVITSQIPEFWNGGENILAIDQDFSDHSDLKFLSFTAASSQSKLTYNLFDVLFSYHYTADRCSSFSMVPYLGARFANFDQKWCVNYRGSVVDPVTLGSDPSSDYEVEGLVRTSWHGKLPAGGLTFGVNGEYGFCGCFYLMGKVGASILGGTAELHEKAKLTTDWELLPRQCPSDDGSDIENDLFGLCWDRHTIITGWDGALGIGMRSCFCGTQIGISAGYEFQNWFNLPQRAGNGFFYPGNSSEVGSSMTLHGLFVRGSIGF